MAKFLDLTGQRFGKLTVIKFSKDVQSGKRKRKYWLCQCDCGNTKEVRTDGLTSGNVKSCGCLHIEKSYKNLTSKYGFKQKHKTQNKRLYYIWYSMKHRCCNPKDERYSRYGGRGITICNEWLNFDNFAKWALSNGYENNLSIDRINNNGNYEPSNCRWTNNKQQCRNRRTNIKTQYNGKEMTLIEISEITNIPHKTLIDRYHRGDRGDRLIRPLTDKMENHSKITKEIALEIREKYKQGTSIKKLSEIYPLTYGSILNIVNMRTWKNI